jgi:hypothetical protein
MAYRVRSRFVRLPREGLAGRLTGRVRPSRRSSTGIWTATLFIDEFVSSLIITAIGAAVSSLQPALGVLRTARATTTAKVATPKTDFH